ncbi:hypothetical protein K530_48295 [Streptomyces noursei CCRC 11814]|uniref:Uncharacterized protein n=1 Tax=Streptomyces noursei TaxID=1971 RepID=A0A401QWP7_STRNR|nr:hypothetical protein K530_48295 [Streptomyces noursei CCRC 11814]GCB89790.1 hypothetical protein SALB_02479 [Streptomyces noursei]
MPGQPRVLAALWIVPRAMGEEARVLTDVSAEPRSSVTRSTHRSESGTHTWNSALAGRPASESATSEEGCALILTSRHLPSVRIASLRAWSATASRAGAMSGEATTASCTASPPHDAPKGSSPLLTATTEPAAAATTTVVARAIVRRRARGRGDPVLGGAESSGKL